MTVRYRPPGQGVRLGQQRRLGNLPAVQVLAGERRERKREEKKRGERMADKWVSQSCGVHVSETGH